MKEKLDIKNDKKQIANQLKELIETIVTALKIDDSYIVRLQNKINVLEKQNDILACIIGIFAAIIAIITILWMIL